VEEEDLCILHSEGPEKDKAAFEEALDRHRRERGCDFAAIVFPRGSNFRGTQFIGGANFEEATFIGPADFRETTFHGPAVFSGVTFQNAAVFAGAQFDEEVAFGGASFNEGADFISATFDEGGVFHGAKFTKGAYFHLTTFNGVVSFRDAAFTREAIFSETEFAERADFSGATFAWVADLRGASCRKGALFGGTIFRSGASFSRARFLGSTLFFPSRAYSGTVPIFSTTEVDFRRVTTEPLDALVLRDVDLKRCQFLGTDLRKAEITGAKWPQIGRRDGVYDEIVPLKEGETRQWHHIERVYRELKQNFEERRDYERARDFHYGEKEMRRKNPDSSLGLRLMLWLYWLVSGYGERCLRPLVWAGILFIMCAGFYLGLGLCPKGESTRLAMMNTWNWLGYSFLYSFQVMTLLRPTDFEPAGLCGRFVYTAQSLLGPLLIGLFALALRQRLKR